MVKNGLFIKKKVYVFLAKFDIKFSWNLVNASMPDVGDMQMST